MNTSGSEPVHSIRWASLRTTSMVELGPYLPLEAVERDDTVPADHEP